MINNYIELPNRIKHEMCCVNCGKSYLKESSFNKHIRLCNLLQYSRKKSQIIIEEDDPMPSQRNMFGMLIELGEKYLKLEEKFEELNKWVVKKKKKINVLEWLNVNIKPNTNFDSIIDRIIINEQDIMNLLDHTFNDVLKEIFSRSIYNFNENESPIFGFVQNKNVFYIYDKDNIWIKSTEKIIKFLEKLHMKIFEKFYQWKMTKMNDIKVDDKLSIRCDKTIIKITSFDFTNKTILSKVINNIFSKIQIDIKALVEYEFEF